MFKIILQRNSTRVSYNAMLCSIRNLSSISDSPIHHLPTTEEKSKAIEPAEKPVKYLPVKKKSEMYPEPVHPLLPSEFKEQELLKLRENIFYAPDHDAVFNIYLQERDKFEWSHFQTTLRRLADLGNERLVESLQSLEFYQILFSS